MQFEFLAPAFHHPSDFGFRKQSLHLPKRKFIIGFGGWDYSEDEKTRYAFVKIVSSFQETGVLHTIANVSITPRVVLFMSILPYDS